MDPQQNNQPPRFKSLLPNSFSKKTWLIIVASIVVGALLGYFYADRNSDKLSQKLEVAEEGSVFAKERVYVNDQLDFSLILPANWVKKVIISNEGSSTGFYFMNAETSEKRADLVLTIYRCSYSDFEALKGNTTDTKKCPGRFLDRDDKTAYTWQESNKKFKVDSTLKSSDSIIDEFNRQVSSTFRIVK